MGNDLRMLDCKNLIHYSSSINTKEKTINYSPDKQNYGIIGIFRNKSNAFNEMLQASYASS